MSQLSYDQSPSPNVLPKAGRNAAGACITLFMLPFLVAGLGVMALGFSEFRRGAATQQWLIPIVFGAVFAAVAIFFVVISFAALRNSAKNAATRAANRDQPWRWRKEWVDGVIVDGTGAAAVGMLIFAIVWSAITAPIVFILLRRGIHEKVELLVMIFPLIGAIMLISAMYQMARRFKYGKSRLMLDHIPIAIGAPFHADIDTKVNDAPENGFLVRMTSARRVTTGSGKSRSTRETILWAEEQVVSAGAAMRSPVGTRVPFTFTIPADAQPTDERDVNDQIVWRVSISAEVPGIDYSAAFEVPVFSTGDTPHAPTRFAAPVAAAASWVPSDESRIVINPLPDGGEEIRVLTRARGGEMFGLSIFSIIWYGVVAIMMMQGIWFFGAVFSLFGAIVLLAILDNFFGRTVIRASQPAFTTRREYPFNLGVGRKLDPMQVESITSNLELSSQNAVSTFTVDATVAGGQHVRVARGIRDRKDAEMLAARLARDIGLDRRVATRDNDDDDDQTGM